MKHLTLSLILAIGMVPMLWAQYVPREKRNRQDTLKTTTRPSTDTPASNRPSRRPAQDETDLSRYSLAQRLQFGGQMNVLFNPTRIDLRPLIGYRITPKLSAGVGVNFLYLNGAIGVNNGIRTIGVPINQSYWGGRAYLNYSLAPTVFLWAELDATQNPILNTARANQSTLNESVFDKTTVVSPLVGGGFQYSGFQITVLYNVAYDQNNAFYPSPLIIRYGFMF